MIAPAKTKQQTVRCAVYGRKSIADHEQEFSSIEAQREAAESFIASQRGNGWQCLPDRYDDNGFTGSNLDRPALANLMADIKAGYVDSTGVQNLYFEAEAMLDALLAAIEEGNTQPDEWIPDTGFALTAGNLAEREMDMWGCILLAEEEAAE